MSRWSALTALGVAALAAAPSAEAAPPDWTLQIGAAAHSRPAHLGSNQYLVEAVPILEASFDDAISISLDDGGGAPWPKGRCGSGRSSNTGSRSTTTFPPARSG